MSFRPFVAEFISGGGRGRRGGIGIAGACKEYVLLHSGQEENT